MPGIARPRRPARPLEPDGEEALRTPEPAPPAATPDFLFGCLGWATVEVGKTPRAAPWAAPPANGEGAFAPRRHTVFRWLWLASLASQMGTWIQNVGAVDVMTVLAPTALMLALVQTATTLPGLFLAL